MFRLAAIAVSAFVLVAAHAPAQAEPSAVGPEKCEKCHREEVKVWEGTQHFKSFKDIHKHKDVKNIIKATGDSQIRRSEVCATCHYTSVEESGKSRPVAGPSCESCHGNASGWITAHNDYGGPNVKREQESAEHKAKRIASAKAAGMIRPEMLYDVAANCMSCHGLANPKLSGEHAAAMLDNGHPLKPEYEIVEYSQGTVRHRFYPPDLTTNKEMTKAEMARLYVIGQAAALVSATEAIKKTKHAKYVEAQQKRIAKAKEALAKVPEASALLASPSADAGRALAEAIAKKDLSGAVGNLLPTKFK
jgi:mono/diheme cytochrome c family protein